MKSIFNRLSGTRVAICVGSLVLAGGFANADVRVTSTTNSAVASQPPFGLWEFGTTYYQSRRLPGGISTDSTWSSLDGGSQVSFGVNGSGSLFVWGSIGTGEDAPLQIGSDSGWKTVAAGGEIATALKTDGSLWAWGAGIPGETGSTQSAVPVQVGSALDWKSIATGKYHRMALRNDGSLWAWGYNSHGTLGDGTSTPRSTPVQISSSTDWAFVAGGFYTSFAIKTDGTLWVWGIVYGTGPNPTSSNAPVQLGTDSAWASIHPSSDANFTFAIKQDGSLWSWGENPRGVLGLGDVLDRNIPTQVGSATDWEAVAPGETHVIATKNDGSIWMWGHLSDSNLPDSTIPEDRTSLFDPNPKLRAIFSNSSDITDGPTWISVRTTILGEPTLNPLLISNEGLLPLTISEINLPAGYSVTPNTLVIPPLDEATFQIQLDPPAKGEHAGELHVINDSSNAPNLQATISGWVVSAEDDTDSDGLNDAAEVSLAALGFYWDSPQTAMVETLVSKANFAGLVSTDRVFNVELKAHAPVIAPDSQSARLHFELYDPAAGVSVPTEIAYPQGQPDGMIRLDFNVPGTFDLIRIHGN